MKNYRAFTQIYVLKEINEKKQNSARKEQKSTLYIKRANVATSTFPVSRHYMKKVLTLLQCRDMAATSTKEGKAKIFLSQDIITTLRRHQVDVATSSRHSYDIAYSEKN